MPDFTPADLKVLEDTCSEIELKTAQLIGKVRSDPNCHPIDEAHALEIALRHVAGLKKEIAFVKSWKTPIDPHSVNTYWSAPSATKVAYAEPGTEACTFICSRCFWNRNTSPHQINGDTWGIKGYVCAICSTSVE